MDIMMPFMGGVECLKLIRQNADLKQTPVILMSAGIRPMSESGDMTYFISKPFNLYKLLNLINNILDSSHDGR